LLTFPYGQLIGFLTLAAMVFLIGRFWGITELSLLLSARRQDTNKLAWFYLGEAIMDRVVAFLVILSIYYIGIRKKGGLWSSSQLFDSYYPLPVIAT